jgi:hypothetical protein
LNDCGEEPPVESRTCYYSTGTAAVENVEAAQETPAEPTPEPTAEPVAETPEEQPSGFLAVTGNVIGPLFQGVNAIYSIIAILIIIALIIAAVKYFRRS